MQNGSSGYLSQDGLESQLTTRVLDGEGSHGPGGRTQVRPESSQHHRWSSSEMDPATWPLEPGLPCHPAFQLVENK